MATSTFRAELTATATTVAELEWIESLASSISFSTSSPIHLYNDNFTAVEKLNSPSFSKETKALDVKVKYVGQLIQQGFIHLDWIPSPSNRADILTKKSPAVTARRSAVCHEMQFLLNRETNKPGHPNTSSWHYAPEPADCSTTTGEMFDPKTFVTMRYVQNAGVEQTGAFIHDIHNYNSPLVCNPSKVDTSPYHSTLVRPDFGPHASDLADKLLSLTISSNVNLLVHDCVVPSLTDHHWNTVYGRHAARMYERAFKDVPKAAEHKGIGPVQIVVEKHIITNDGVKNKSSYWVEGSREITADWLLVVLSFQMYVEVISTGTYITGSVYAPHAAYGLIRKAARTQARFDACFVTDLVTWLSADISTISSAASGSPMTSSGPSSHSLVSSAHPHFDRVPVPPDSPLAPVLSHLHAAYQLTHWTAPDAHSARRGTSGIDTA
ncbi:hypothetical protein JCM5296_002113 [Sporobolomyces johnsonii]